MRDLTQPGSLIVVPLDGSSFAEQALPLAASLAAHTGCQLRLALVHELPFLIPEVAGASQSASVELASRAAEQEYLRRIKDSLRATQGLRVDEVALHGVVGPALAEYVREVNASMVVLATHGRGGVKRAWLGSVADYLIRHLSVPVLMVRPAIPATLALPAPPCRILVPLDGSPLSEEILESVVVLARAWKLPVHLIQAVRPVMLPMDPTLGVPAVYDERLTGLSRAEAQDYLDDMTEELRDQDIPATATTVLGANPADAILSAATSGDFALIALATHGRGGLTRLALGSVADKVARGSEMPVLVHHPSSADGVGPWPDLTGAEQAHR